MKKAKLLLVAIAVFATVGGAYAIKASRGKTIFCAAAAGGTPAQKLNYTITEPNVGVQSFCTTLASGSVAQTWITRED